MTSTDDKETIFLTIKRVEDVRFTMLVMKPLYRTYVTPHIILYCDFTYDIEIKGEGDFLSQYIMLYFLLPKEYSIKYLSITTLNKLFYSIFDSYDYVPIVTEQPTGNMIILNFTKLCLENMMVLTSPIKLRTLYPGQHVDIPQVLIV